MCSVAGKVNCLPPKHTGCSMHMQKVSPKQLYMYVVLSMERDAATVQLLG